uniref:Uncharacterized protein n=1 Tax=Arundo donax TaxID=35708 RepID=A0A0A9DQ41_ARUDO
MMTEAQSPAGDPRGRRGGCNEEQTIAARQALRSLNSIRRTQVDIAPASLVTVSAPLISEGILPNINLRCRNTAMQAILASSLPEVTSSR